MKSPSRNSATHLKKNSEFCLVFLLLVFFFWLTLQKLEFDWGVSSLEFSTIWSLDFSLQLLKQTKSFCKTALQSVDSSWVGVVVDVD